MKTGELIIWFKPIYEEDGRGKLGKWRTIAAAPTSKAADYIMAKWPYRGECIPLPRGEEPSANPWEMV